MKTPHYRTLRELLTWQVLLVSSFYITLQENSCCKQCIPEVRVSSWLCKQITCNKFVFYLKDLVSSLSITCKEINSLLHLAMLGQLISQYFPRFKDKL